MVYGVKKGFTDNEMREVNKTGSDQPSTLASGPHQLSLKIVLETAMYNFRSKTPIGQIFSLLPMCVGVLFLKLENEHSLQEKKVFFETSNLL